MEPHRVEAGVSAKFFEQPVLNSPYEYPGRHWRLENGVPTDYVEETRRRYEYVSPVPPPRRQRGRPHQDAMRLGIEEVSTPGQEYAESQIIGPIRGAVDAWRQLPNPKNWGVSPVTQRLLQHWRGTSHEHQGVRPFFCQVEAVETVIWLTEVTKILGEGAPVSSRNARTIRKRLKKANEQANPELLRIALKLATGAGKTTVMAMLIAWQAVNAARSPQSSAFTNNFLVVTPGITIRDRLRVLLPNDPENYYERRDLVPDEMLDAVRQAEVVITNYHAFRLRERESISKGTRAFLQGRGEDAPRTTETPGQMLSRVMPKLLARKKNGVFALNDEGHHCYREKQGDDSEERSLGAEEREEAKRNAEAARLWISGLETVKSAIGLRSVVDLSATPFFLRGSGYREGMLFPWTVSDFSLMDAIESGVVKVPRVPVADNLPSGEMPKFRNLWGHIGKDMPLKGRRGATGLDARHLPDLLCSAIDALYSDYEKTFAQWRDANVRTPPVFIVVCNNTATSKLVYDYIAGSEYPTGDDGEIKPPHLGRLALFSNYDADGSRRASPRTLLIDSAQLESGDALSKEFREMEADAIAQFRRERAQRGGAGADDDIADAELLREALNTVGKEGRLGANIRCVVSVSMLTEGWDANTVTHILGVRAFGTQLLCEQVIGRALRRLSYELNAEGLFEAEYADALGIPFDFTAQDSPPAAPKPPASVVRVHAVSPERDELEVVFPRVSGYRIELPDERLHAVFDADSSLELTPKLVGPSSTRNEGIVGEGVTLTPDNLDEMRLKTIAFHLAERLLSQEFREQGEPPKMGAYKQLLDITCRWLEEGHLRCSRGTYPAQVLYPQVVGRAVELINTGIRNAARDSDDSVVKAILHPYNPVGSTRNVNFLTSNRLLYQTRADKSHVNWAVCDSEWEAEFCRVAEEDPRVLAYVKNKSMGFEVPYRLGDAQKSYVPDFIVLLDDGGGLDDPLQVIVETKGYRREDDVAKANAMRSLWVPGVNALGDHGRWAFVELRDLVEMDIVFHLLVESKEEGTSKAAGELAARRLAVAGGSAPDMAHIPRRRSEAWE